MNNCRVLVIGGAGYIGSHMVMDLLDKGCQVITLDNLVTGHRDLVSGGVFIQGDLGDQDLLDNIFSSWRIDAVMHFAAFSIVGESVRDPLKYYRNNIAKTLDLVEAMVRHGVKRFIFSSSAAVYGDPEDVPITEEHPCRPTNPYGATKLAVERLLHDCDGAYGLQYACLRYFNAAGAHPSCAIGERHRPESHLIPLVLEVAAGKRENISIFGTDYPTADGACLRDYVHVNDLTRAHLLALERLMAGNGSDTYNLGNSKGYSVREVIALAREITGRPIPATEASRRAGDPAVLVADSQKARLRLGWRPVHENLAAIIESAWHWHQQEALRNSMFAKTS